MANITLTINGKKIRFPEGRSVFEAAGQHGIEIPHLCYHPDLEPYGACRLCVVEDEKTGRIMASCVTPVAESLSILTASPRVMRHRRNILRLMMAEHPDSCVVCSKGNRCRLRAYAAQMGIGLPGLYPMPNYKTLEQANPFIVRDLSKCILCGKCVRADHEMVVVGAIDYLDRGFRSRPATLHDFPLEQSNCTFCGTCVSICPTGALSTGRAGYEGTPEREALSVCGFCGVGCALSLGAADGRVVEVNPAHRKDSVNGSTLCVRGHFAHDFLHHEDRLTDPLIRENGDLVQGSWERALDLVAGRLLTLKKDFGPQSVALLGSSKCSNEENYLFQKMARVLLETNNVDNGGYIWGRPAWNVLENRTGGGARVNRCADLEKAEAIFVLGADPGHSAPVLSYCLKRASRKGVPLVVADPRKTEMVGFSTLWLPLLPQSDLDFLQALSALLCRWKAYDGAFIERYTAGFETFRQGLSSMDPEQGCRMAGIDMSMLEQTAHLLSGKKTAFVVGHGVLQQRDGAFVMDALLNLALMTGNLAEPGTGFYLIARENNQVGAWDMGAVPHALPGRMALADDAARRHWGAVWQHKISPDQGLNLVRMIQEADKGTLKALYILGENPLRTLPQTELIRSALGKLDLLVVQDVLRTETTASAHVVLPGATFAEKAGSFTNLEGRVQYFDRVVPPPGEAKPDWEILDLLGEKMGYPMRFGSLERISAEITRHVPMYAEAGSDGGWVKETSRKSLFRFDGQGEALSFAPLRTADHPRSDRAYPYTAILGVQRFHLGGGTRTAHSTRIREWGSGGALEIGLEDAEELNVKNGSILKVTSPLGSLRRPVRLERGLRPGLLFIPMACHDNDAMNLMGLTPFETPRSSGLKTCRVNLETQQEPQQGEWNV